MTTPQTDTPTSRATLVEQVRAFHEKYAAPVDEFVETLDLKDVLEVDKFAQELHSWSMKLRHRDAGRPFSIARQRLSLLTEELAELADGMVSGDEEEVFDAICDLNYLVAGSAVAYGMPLDEGTAEVHRSNMTKDVGEFKPIKGPDYSEPNLYPILVKLGRA
tara:strand:- start:11081 stop:11566 length:486 start_codon:yes stop_codon:yes gene_type:complete